MPSLQLVRVCIRTCHECSVVLTSGGIIPLESLGQAGVFGYHIAVDAGTVLAVEVNKNDWTPQLG